MKIVPGQKLRRGRRGGDDRLCGLGGGAGGENERETRGKVQRSGTEMRAEIVSPAGPTQFVLPPPTLLPVAAINHLIERLGAKAAAFPALTFDAEVVGDAFLVDVTELNDGDRLIV